MDSFLITGFIIYVFTALLFLKSDVPKRKKIYGITTLFTVYIFTSYYLLFGNPVEKILISQFGELATSLPFLLSIIMILILFMFLCLWLYKFISRSDTNEKL